MKVTKIIVRHEITFPDPGGAADSPTYTAGVTLEAELECSPMSSDLIVQNANTSLSGRALALLELNKDRALTRAMCGSNRRSVGRPLPSWIASSTVRGAMARDKILLIVKELKDGPGNLSFGESVELLENVLKDICPDDIPF